MKESRFSEYKIMWILVLFDLPTETKSQRKAAGDFRKKLLSDGFVMFQYSIYVRHTPSRENMVVHEERVCKLIPEEGKVCILHLTDRQFGEMRVYEKKKMRKPMINAIQLELF